jgi:hypothetical protein
VIQKNDAESDANRTRKKFMGQTSQVIEQPFLPNQVLGLRRMKLLIEHLRRRRSLLWKAYVAHVGWFTSTCAFAATDGSQAAIATSLWLALITVPPVLFYTVSVHKACRAIDPAARSVGWAPVILATVLLTPFESGLVLPARNLWVSRCILRAWEKAQAVGPPIELAARSRLPLFSRWRH